MSDICQWNRKSTAIPRKKGISLNWGTGVKVRRRATAPVMHLFGMLPQSRKEKVLVVRQQIAEGTYDLDKHMDSILDRLLKDFVA
jgi:anti-sigma28 factor (negative regulator of flagellin synthesis)